MDWIRRITRRNPASDEKAAEDARAVASSDRVLAEVIVGRLWQSGRPLPLEAVEERGINAVVSVGGAQPWIADWVEQAKFSDLEEGLPVLRIALHAPLIDREGGLDVVAADTVVAAVLRLLDDPDRRVLVHCDAGHFRSVHIAACVLALRSGISGREALGKVDAAGSHWPVRKAMGFEDWDRYLDEVTTKLHFAAWRRT